jgi:hypothetical protein
MKITLVSFLALTALTIAPIAGHASDKEVQKARYSHPSCQCPHRQVALFVSGRGVGDNQQAPRTQSISTAQMGQGGGLTFFTR